ncbi:hypothetical protein B0H14DRAFT_660657 [Mycena olivaceomarginata]|nr:hypothetical protein B0H14DRAFT_660657 [Mycena olivaceomarginata]
MRPSAPASPIPISDVPAAERIPGLTSQSQHHTDNIGFWVRSCVAKICSRLAQLLWRQEAACLLRSLNNPALRACLSSLHNNPLAISILFYASKGRLRIQLSEMQSMALSICPRRNIIVESLHPSQPSSAVDWNNMSCAKSIAELSAVSELLTVDAEAGTMVHLRIILFVSAVVDLRQCRRSSSFCRDVGESATIFPHSLRLALAYPSSRSRGIPSAEKHGS